MGRAGNRVCVCVCIDVHISVCVILSACAAFGLLQRLSNFPADFSESLLSPMGEASRGTEVLRETHLGGTVRIQPGGSPTGSVTWSAPARHGDSASATDREGGVADLSR